MPHPAAAGRIAAALVIGLLPGVAVAAPAAGAVTPTANPPIEQSCGLDLTLVLDASGSVASSHAVEDVRDAASALLHALSGTSSTARVTQFATLAEELAARGQVDDEALERTGPLGESLQRYYNPLPPRPANRAIYQYRSGPVQQAGSYRASSSSTQYTNWDGALHQVRDDAGELVVFVTDGDPTAFDLDQPGDPFDGSTPPDVAVHGGGGAVAQSGLDRAVTEANAVKATGARVLAIGVGGALSSAASQSRLRQISGPQVVRDADLGSVDSLNDIDVALVRDFGDLSAFMRGLVLELCSPSLTVRKLAQTADDPAYEPLQGQQVTVTPTVPSGTGFAWILPDTSAAVSKSDGTDVNGFAQFQWEPVPPEASSVAEVAEATDPDRVPGRPGVDDDYRCEARDADGGVRVVTGDFADPGDPRFVLDPIGQEVVTCTVWNSYDYQPAIAVTKSNTPTVVRGDLDPPATVTSSYAVTNPGNAPLDSVGLVDDRCGPVVPVPVTGDNAGDTDADGLLDVGEQWSFTCGTPVTSGAATAVRSLVNTVEAHGLDPRGTRVTDTTTASVDVHVPAVTLVKTVDGADEVQVGPTDAVTYRYEATASGSTPLGSVGLVDDQAACASPTRGPDAPGDGDAVLDLGETWVWTCTTTPGQDVVNTATVTGTPLDPGTGLAFVGTNPPVTATDVASVDVRVDGVVLTKVPSPDVVLLDAGDAPPPETVTYTFTAENTGDDPLTRDGAAPTDPGWVEDTLCVGATVYQGGDDSPANGLLDPGETWTFTCDQAIDEGTVNVARIEGLPTDGGGTPLPLPSVVDLAAAYVPVLRPQVEVLKAALRPVVLDPDADAVAGPDTPAPRAAEYGYLVSNPGDVPLQLTTLDDDTCAPLTLTAGDTDLDGLLDPGEVWEHTCTTPLEREQSSTPPGDGSGLVRNTVTVTGSPVVGGSVVVDPAKHPSATGTADVLVVEPGLALTKTASAAVVRAGDDVTYTVEVTGTGDVDLTPTAVTDDACAPLTFVGGDTDGDGRVDGANSTPETWSWTCTRPVPAPTPPATADTNTASVRAVDPLGNAYVAQDSAEVEVVTADVDVVKSPDLLLVPAGTDVTYTFDVTNTGTNPDPALDALGEVEVADVAVPALPDCVEPTLVARLGGDQDALLERDPDETWRYRCTARTDDWTLDVAVVGAVGGLAVDQRLEVLAADVALVGVFRPAVTVAKSASAAELAAPGGDVTYTYRVRNTGDVPLADVADRITDDTCGPLRYASGDTDGDGLLDTPDSLFEDAADETWTFTCTSPVRTTTTNVVEVLGSPVGPTGLALCGPGAVDGLVDDPCDVRASSTATVRVLPAADPVTAVPGGSGQVAATGAGGTGPLLAWAAALLAAGSGALALRRRAGRGRGARLPAARTGGAP